MQWKSKLNIKKVMAIVFFLTGIISLFWSSSIYVRQTKKMLHEESQRMIQEIATQGAESITDRLRDEFVYLDTVIDTMIKDTTISNQYKSRKLDQIKVSKGIRNLGIASLEGTLWLTNGETYQILDTTYFREALKGERYISEVIVSRIDGELVVTYAIPITNKEEDEIKAVMVAIYTAQELFERVSKGFFEGEGYLYLINKQGYIKYGSKGISPQMIEAHKKWHKKRNQPEEDIDMRFCKGYLESEQDNYYAIVPIEGASHWKLLYMISTEEVSKNTGFIIAGMYKGAAAISAIFTCIICYILVSGVYNKKKIYELAYHSHETGLYNRHKFIEEVKKKLIRAKKEYTVLYFDIDNFRIYSEFFDKNFGEKLIKEIAQQLESCFKAYDVTFAHLERDHFAIFLPVKEDQELLKVVRLIESRLHQIQIDDHPPVHIILSTGIYKVPKHSVDIEGAINKAGLARRRVKGNQEIRYSFYDEREGQMLKADHQLKLDIIDAVESKQFSIYYQPKFQSHSHHIAGAEALIRWNHPGEGNVSPSRFIPLAEANGSILSITKYVLEEVCKDISKWQNQGIPIVPISINFSQIEMYNPDILEYIKDCLKKYEIDPSYLEIEITERVALEDLQTAKRMIMAFKALGITVSMDDFGSGYSGPNYIKALPFDTIKLDKVLIDDIETDTKSHQLLLGIVNVMKALGVQIVAEGVENTRQVQCIEQMGVDYIQGYVFAKPLSKQEFEWKLTKKVE